MFTLHRKHSHSLLKGPVIHYVRIVKQQMFVLIAIWHTQTVSEKFGGFKC